MSFFHCSDPWFANTECHGHGTCLPLNASLPLNGTETAYSNKTGVQRNEIQTREYTCACNEGWTGRSDWINYNEFVVNGTLRSDCQLNEYALRSCWVLLALLSLKSLKTSVKVLKGRLQARKKKKGTRRKKISLRKDTTFMFSLCAMLSMIQLFALAVIKAGFGQKYLVAKDVAVTILYSVGRCCFYTGVVYAQNMFLHLAFGSALARKHKGFLKKARRNAWLKCVLIDYVGGLITIAALFDPSPEWAIITYKSKWVYGIVGMLGNGVAVINISKSMKNAFNEGMENDKRMAKVISASKKFKKRAAKSVLVNLPAGLIFLLVQSAWGFWSYFLPLQFCLIPMTAGKLSKMFMGNNKGKKKGKRKKKQRVAPEGSEKSDSSEVDDAASSSNPTAMSVYNTSLPESETNE